MGVSRGVLGLPLDDDDPAMQSICLVQGRYVTNCSRGGKQQAKRYFKDRMDEITTHKCLKHTNPRSQTATQHTLSASAQPVLLIEQAEYPLSLVISPVPPQVGGQCERVLPATRRGLKKTRNVNWAPKPSRPVFSCGATTS